MRTRPVAALAWVALSPTKFKFTIGPAVYDKSIDGVSSVTGGKAMIGVPYAGGQDAARVVRFDNALLVVTP